MRSKWILIGAVAAAIALAALWWVRQGPMAVELATPTRGPAVEAIYATGSVEPTISMPIAPRTAARITQLGADEGAEVRKGQLLVRLDDADLASTVEELAARAAFARAQHERTRSLFEKGFVSQVELDRTRADLDASDAALRRARSQRDYMSLVAPADGTIIRRDGEVGQFIPAGQAIFHLSCCAPLRVTAEVDEEDIPRVHVGQRVVLRADAVPGRVFEGDVKEVTPKGDPVARSYRVRIRLAEPDALRVGMTVDANLIVSERANALLVPTSAVKDGAVWTVVDGRLARRAVKAGVTGSGRTEIVSGLEAQAQVVVDPTGELREGRRARARQAK